MLISTPTAAPHHPDFSYPPPHRDAPDHRPPMMVTTGQQWWAARLGLPNTIKRNVGTRRVASVGLGINAQPIMNYELCIIHYPTP